MTSALDVSLEPARPALRSTRFREERSGEWAELERILLRFERRGARGLDDADLLALPRLYRATLSSLSVARATSLDQGVVDYLQALSTRAYYAVHGTPERMGPRAQSFFRRDWPMSVRTLAPETVFATLTLLLGAVVAYVLVGSDPEWFYRFMPEMFSDGRDPSATTEELRDTLYHDGDAEGLGVFASQLWFNNSGVALFAFALGFAFGVPTLMLLFYNGLIIGCFVKLFVSKGLGMEMGGWLIIHGATELLAIVLAGAAGLHIGRAVAFPGALTRADAARLAGGRAGAVAAGCVVMLFLAGLIEGYGRQLITSDAIRYAFGLTTLALWLLYFYLPRRDA